MNLTVKCATNVAFLLHLAINFSVWHSQCIYDSVVPRFDVRWPAQQLLCGFAKVWDSWQRIIKSYARDLFEAVWINLIELCLFLATFHGHVFLFSFFGCYNHFAAHYVLVFSMSDSPTPKYTKSELWFGYLMHIYSFFFFIFKAL